MIYIPQSLTEFTYSNIPNLVAEYDKEVTYSISDFARVGSWLYKSIIDDNTDNTPLDNLGIKWYDGKYPSNTYSMLDLLADTKTEWDADGIVEFKRGTNDTLGIGNFKATEVKIEYLDAINGVVDGMTIATSVDLDSTVLAGYAYVDLTRVDLEDTPNTFTASVDTYVDIDEDGTLVFTEVANEAAAPTLTSPNERLAKVVTDADNITSVEDLRTVIDPVLETQTYTFSVNGDVWDEWDYGYAGFTDSVSEAVYAPIKIVGTTIRVTFSASGLNTYCGYMIAGVATAMGNTLDKVGFPDKRVGRRIISVADFKTIVERNQLMRKSTEAKALINETMLFVIDESESSDHNNMVILGKISKCSSIGEVATKNFITWQIIQTILE